MSETVADVVIGVSADIGPLMRETQRASGAVKAWGSSVQRDAGMGAKGVSDAMARASSAAASFGASFTKGLALGLVSAGFAAVTSNIRGTIGAIADMADEADRIGVTADDFQALQFGMKTAGVSADEFASSLGKFADNISDAARGTGTLKNVLADAGIALRDNAGAIRPTTDLLRDYADLIKTIPDEATRMSMITEAFGRGGKAMTLALAGGSAGLDQMMQSSRDAGVVLDQSIVDKARVLDDKFDLLTARVKVFFETVAVGAADSVDALLSVQHQAQATLDAATGGKIDQIIDPSQAADLKANADAAFDLSGNLEALAASYSNAADEAEALSGMILEAAASARLMGDNTGAERLQALANVIQDLAAGYRDGRYNADKFKEGLDKATGAASVAVAEVSKIDDIDLGNVGSAVDALRGLLSNLAGQAVATASAVATALAAKGSNSAPATGGSGRPDLTPVRSNLAPTSSPTPEQRSVDSPSFGGGGGGGGGGSGSSPSHAELDALIKDLEDEKAAVEAWYAESAALLQGATDAQLAALGGRHDAIEKLEAEHQARLSGIRDGSNSDALANSASFFNSLATITQAGGEKANKAYRAFAAAEALINAYRAASQTLAIPGLNFYQKFAQYASVLSAGLGLVSALKGGGGSSGGSAGGGSSVGSSPSGVAAQVPARATITVNGLMDAGGFKTLTDQLNAEFRQGYILDIVKP